LRGGRGDGGNGGNGLGGGFYNSGIASLSYCTIEFNKAEGGAGGYGGGNGGDGQGGGVFNSGPSPQGVPSITFQTSRIVNNDASGAGSGGSDGQGQGGGLYLTPDGHACADPLTIIVGNHASTSDDDVFGDLGLC
jgi:hypothetical protein